MTAEILHDRQKIEKQMGCMAGFLHIFDRNQFLAGKRVYATKRLPSSSPVTDSTSQSEKSEESPQLSKELNQPKQAETVATPLKSPSVTDSGLKSTWKFRETPRLSLDSRMIVDGKGSLYPREIRTNAAILSATNAAAEDDRQTRSPSVVARLMGLEALPESPLKKPELRRSASESRLLHCGFVDGNNSFHQSAMREPVAEKQRSEVKAPEISMKKLKHDQSSTNFPWKSQQRKNFYDSQDFFPEPAKQTSSLYGELEKRLKMRGIAEPAEDLETLKQILEALQLKGLLHSRRRRSEQISNRNFIVDQKLSYSETPAIFTKPSKSPGRFGNQSPPPSSLRGVRRNNNVETLPPVRRRLERSLNENSERRFSNSMSPDRSESNIRSPRSPARKKMLTVETQKRVEQKRNSHSPLNSPKLTSKKNGPDQVSRSPRNTNRRFMAEISSSTEDESSSISESCFSTVSQKPRRLKTDDFSEGKSLLARCDNLLNSIADITTTESQPSPVSVLDSSFYNEDVSPLKQRCIDFKDQVEELEDEEDNSISMISSFKSKSDDTDFVYASEIFEACSSNSEESTLFSSLEKSSSSSVSKLHRRLVFDTITEIIDRRKQLPPWKAVCNTNPVTGKPLFRPVWLEFSRIRERSKGEELCEVVDGALGKDLAEETINGWGDYTMEKSEMVLDIERLIFKDLIGETIREFAATFTGKSRGLVPKKLAF